MDIKELGITGFIVVGGAIYGISEYGLGDVLQNDLKHVSEVPYAEREAYMKSVTVQFTEFYGGAVFGTDEFATVGSLSYELAPKRTTFIQVVDAQEKVTKAQEKDLKSFYSNKWVCETEDVLLFTDKGWTYTTKLKNTDGRTMVVVTCKPTNSSNLRS